MSAAKQIFLSLVVIAVAAAGWFAYDRGFLTTIESAPATAGQAGGGGPAGGGPGGAPGPGGAGSGRGGAILVVTAGVGMDDAGMDVRAIGTVAATRAVTLHADASGVVVEASFKPGTSVTEGQTLIRLDDADQRIAVEKAKIALETARSAADRAQQLARSNNISSVALTEARTGVQKAEIDLKAAENDLAKRIVAAPFAGTVGLTDVTIGDLVNSQKPITTLDDMSKVTVTFDLPERASGLVASGQPVTATTEALPGQSFAGLVSAVDSRVDPTARTLKVQATLPNDLNILKPGMALAVSLAFPGEKHPVVPSLAILWDRNGPYVWKVEGDAVHRVPVQILGRRSGTAIVTGTLVLNDEVVVEGLQRLRDGATVTRAGAPAGARRPAPEGGGAPEGAGAAARPLRPPSG